MNTPSPAEEQEKAHRALSALRRMADVWAVEVKLNEVIDNIVSPMRLNPNAPTDVREGFAKRMREQIDAFVLQAFIEGAYRAHCNATDALNTRIAELEGRVAVLSDAVKKTWASYPDDFSLHDTILCRHCKGASESDENFPHDHNCIVVATSAQAHLAELRNAALEEAAKARCKWCRGGYPLSADRCLHQVGENATAWCDSTDIHALKSTQEPTP